MLEFVGQITLDSASIRREDVDRLRDEHGFSDVQILEIVQLAAWFNYITRVADALGIEVEDWRADWKAFILG